MGAYLSSTEFKSPGLRSLQMCFWLTFQVTSILILAYRKEPAAVDRVIRFPPILMSYQLQFPWRPETMLQLMPFLEDGGCCCLLTTTALLFSKLVFVLESVSCFHGILGLNRLLHSIQTKNISAFLLSLG